MQMISRLSSFRDFPELDLETSVINLLTGTGTSTSRHLLIKNAHNYQKLYPKPQFIHKFIHLGNLSRH